MQYDYENETFLRELLTHHDNAGRAVGRQVTRNQKVLTLIVRVVSFLWWWCCYDDDDFMLCDLGHVTKSFCVWSVISSFKREHDVFSSYFEELQKGQTKDKMFEKH